MKRVSCDGLNGSSSMRVGGDLMLLHASASNKSCVLTLNTSVNVLGNVGQYKICITLDTCQR